MKIVINADFGGFSLSSQALELYLNKKGIKFYKLKNKDDIFGGENYYTIPKEENEKTQKGFISSYDFDRTDPILIEVVKELKARANGGCANLKIIEIPDNIEYEIEEYDGLESVHEKHRSWS